MPSAGGDHGVMPLVIAHLSDTHFGYRPGSADRTRRVLEHLAALDPPADVVLVTGDVADHGTAEEYAEAQAVLGGWPGPAPMLVCPGNHDVRETYAAWRGLPTDVPANQAHRVGGVLFLMADSLVPAPEGERIDHGDLAPETLAWLDRELTDRGPGERAVVCLHHPPLDVGISLMDPIRLRDPEALAAVLARHEHVVAVLTGHIHSMSAGDVAGVAWRAPGGVASTVVLDAEGEPPITETLPPAYAVHLLDGDRLVTHWRALPTP